jgi:hypothetical protein
MATIVTRAGKGSPLTNNEVDANFTNLNSDKLESGDTAASLTITSADINGGTIDGVTIGGASAGAGTFSSLVATTADINGGTLDGVTIGGASAGAGTFSSLVATTADINGGTIDGVTIGGASAGAATFTSATVNGNPIATAGSLSNRNKVINGAMQIAQRGTNFAGGTTNADDAYTLDRWYVLSEGSDSVDVDQVADSPDTGGKCIRLDVETTGEKFGIAQIVEASNCTGLIGNTVTLSFAAKVSDARIDTVKAAVVAWSGTADTVTSDIISAWNADGTTPTLIANATFENTPADLGVTTSWATYEITATVDTASTANLIVFIWSDDATNPLAGDFLYVTNVQLEAGDTATPFEHRSYGQELALCQRYYQTSYVYGTAVDAATGPTEGASFVTINTSDASNGGLLPVTMRATPTFAMYSTTGGSGSPSARDNVNSVAVTGITLIGGTTTSLPRLNKGGGLSATGSPYSAHYTASAEL